MPLVAKFLCVFAALMLTAPFAWAEATGAPTPLAPGAKSGKPGKARRTVIGRISLADCRRLVVTHIADPGVSFRPGRDVYGRRVAPAELPGQPRIALPKVFRIRISVDLETYLGIVPPPGLDPDVPLGWLTVRGDKVYFNGQPLDDPHQSFIAAQCRRRLRHTR